MVILEVSSIGSLPGVHPATHRLLCICVENFFLDFLVLEYLSFGKMENFGYIESIWKIVIFAIGRELCSASVQRR